MFRFLRHRPQPRYDPNWTPRDPRVTDLSVRFEESADPGNTDTLMGVIQEAEDEGLYELLDEDLHIIKYLVDELFSQHGWSSEETMEAITYLLDKVWERDYTKYKRPASFDGSGDVPRRMYSPLDVLTGALAEAAKWDNVEIAELILEHGADPNHIDFYGRTPLFYSGPNVTRLLLSNGAADPDAKDFEGLTPNTYRIKASHLEGDPDYEYNDRIWHGGTRAGFVETMDMIEEASSEKTVMEQHRRSMAVQQSARRRLPNFFNTLVDVPRRPTPWGRREQDTVRRRPVIRNTNVVFDDTRPALAYGWDGIDTVYGNSYGFWY